MPAVRHCKHHTHLVGILDQLDHIQHAGSNCTLWYLLVGLSYHHCFVAVTVADRNNYHTHLAQSAEMVAQRIDPRKQSSQLKLVEGNFHKEIDHTEVAPDMLLVACNQHNQVVLVELQLVPSLMEGGLGNHLVVDNLHPLMSFSYGSRH